MTLHYFTIHYITLHIYIYIDRYTTEYINMHNISPTDLRGPVYATKCQASWRATWLAYWQKPAGSAQPFQQRDTMGY